MAGAECAQVKERKEVAWSQLDSAPQGLCLAASREQDSSTGMLGSEVPAARLPAEAPRGWQESDPAQPLSPPQPLGCAAAAAVAPSPRAGLAGIGHGRDPAGSAVAAKSLLIPGPVMERPKPSRLLMYGLKDPKYRNPGKGVIFHVLSWKYLVKRINANTHLHLCSRLPRLFLLTANVILEGSFGI